VIESPNSLLSERTGPGGPESNRLGFSSRRLVSGEPGGEGSPSAVRDAATIDDYHPETVYFERRLNAFGPQALELEVAGIRARLEASRPSRSRSSRRATAFLRDAMRRRRLTSWSA